MRVVYGGRVFSWCSEGGHWESVERGDRENRSSNHIVDWRGTNLVHIVDILLDAFATVAVSKMRFLTFHKRPGWMITYGSVHSQNNVTRISNTYGLFPLNTLWFLRRDQGACSRRVVVFCCNRHGSETVSMRLAALVFQWFPKSLVSLMRMNACRVFAVEQSSDFHPEVVNVAFEASKAWRPNNAPNSLGWVRLFGVYRSSVPYEVRKNLSHGLHWVNHHRYWWSVSDIPSSQNASAGQKWLIVHMKVLQTWLMQLHTKNFI